MRRILCYMTLAFIGISNLSCSALSGRTTPSLTASTIPVLPSVTPTMTHQPVIIIPTTTRIPPTPSLTDTQQPLPTFTCTPVQACPDLLSPGSGGFLTEGSLLFYETGLEVIWGIAAHSTTAEMVVTLSPDSLVYSSELSPDGRKIAWEEFTNEQKNLIILDLATGEELKYPFQQATWFFVQRWINDNQVKITIDSEIIYGIGYWEKYVNFDILTGEWITVEHELDLPNTTMLEGYPLFGSFAVDPTGKLVLYTVYDEEDDYDHVILRDLETEQEIWKSPPTGFSWFTLIDWTDSGNRVAFTMPSVDEYLTEIGVLTREGQLFEIFTPLPKQRIIRQIQWSPDARYLYFADWKSISEGPAYLIDMETKVIREICTPGYTFVDVYWLPGGEQLAYTVRAGTDVTDLGIMELRILDLPTWTTQVLAIGTDKNQDFKILGWTPVEFP